MKRGESGLSLLLGIDKPSGPTSHDVVDAVRRALGERRVGHAGTLDPDASGVMVLGIGVATRLLTYLSADRKSYLARFIFGSETATDDAAGEVTVLMAVPDELREEDFAKRTMNSLVGVCEQVPPAYSAAHVNGRRAYSIARSGSVPKLSARSIEIFTSELLSIAPSDDGGVAWTCVLEVSKGTYIRSIARDLGRSLGTAAHLGELRRMKSGRVAVSQCINPHELDHFEAQRLASSALDPLVALNMARRDLTESELDDVVHGRRIACGMVNDAGVMRIPHADELVGIVHGGRLQGVWQCRDASLACACNLPGGVAGVGE